MELPGMVPETPEALQEQDPASHSPAQKDARDQLPTMRYNHDRAETQIPVAEQGLFSFKELGSIKDQIQQCMQKQEAYSVFIYYKEESKWSWIAMHPLFENVTLAVISLNAVYIAVDTDWNKDEPLTPTDTNSLTESGAFFQFMEHAFCVYFTFEWLVRFMAFEKKRNGLRDAWFCFDSCLVFMMVMETWVLLIVMAAAGGSGGFQMGGTSILRLFRLLRLSRLMRMLRSLPELMILIKGMVTAMKSVAYVMGLLVLITYVFAIAFTQLSVSTESFGYNFCANVSHSMYTLLLYGTFFDDLSQFTDAQREEMPALLILTFIFISLAALTVMNMLIGVLCEIIAAVAEKERAAMQIETLSARMREIMTLLDRNKNGMICYSEFADIIQNPEALAVLTEVGVDPLCVVDFAELFFFEDGVPVAELTFEGLMEMVLDLRSSNMATVKDMLNLWMKFKGTTHKVISSSRQALDSVRMRSAAKIDKIDAAHARMEVKVVSILKDLKRHANTT
jgi:hypothetical protein